MDLSVWKRRGLIAAGVLVTLVGAFSAGRFSAPRQVQVIDTAHLVFQDRVVEKIKTVEVQVQAKAETKIVYRDRVVSKDGTVTEHEVEKTATATQTSDVKTDTDKKAEQRNDSIETTHQQTVTLQPKWGVGLLVGASYPKPLVPIAGPLVLGAEVDYRIIGGLSAGIWLNTFGAGGIALRFEF